ncbi:hypothetical protein LX12_001773 [Williamsia serinedens]|uniref:Uncharacterized protein n=2 Tax=Williamsia serinedens TaxID=391736 RepID=A0ABT1H064_9NOCA|nr:hypothetical protein [Williamsia serinedens]
MVSDSLLLVLWVMVAALAVIHSPRDRPGIVWCRHCADRPVSGPRGLCAVCGARPMPIGDNGIEELGF